MPELPEVTTIVSDLKKYVRGKKIAAVSGDTPKLIQPLSLTEFEKKIKGKYFTNFERRGKFIIAHLSSSIRSDFRLPIIDFLVWHMRMTGHLLFRDEKKENKAAKRLFADPRNQFIRFSFYFTDGTRLDFSDMRKFGTLHLFSAARIAQCRGLAVLGPDALNHGWTAAQLRQTLRRKKVALKQALLDQALVAGIGNIYADEILWTAKLHPLLATKTLTLTECAVLRQTVKKVLRAAIKARGSSVDDYRDVRGRLGVYGQFHRVYRRENEDCFRCGEKIVRIIVNGRGTCFCPACQKTATARLVVKK